MIENYEKKYRALVKQEEKIKNFTDENVRFHLLQDLHIAKVKTRKKASKNLSASDRVYLARHPKRPKTKTFVETLLDEPIYFHGDRAFGDDKSIAGGIAEFNGDPVTFLATVKGETLEENLKYNFGMPSPEGYRKAIRLMRQADKFNRPIITFVDTPGAYPGSEAEKRGQGEAIASCIECMTGLKVPVITVITGEGGSGGALALAVANQVMMLENAVYSILTPEGFASILWKDSNRSEEAAEMMKLTAEDLKTFGVCDRIIKEEVCFEKSEFDNNLKRVKLAIEEELKRLKRFSEDRLKHLRMQKFRRIGRGF
ncbi:MAG: acetyl-CoA carboxylase carboxyltransferase subunit alpha [Eubacteriaceae bacterium]|jgi:acetyl-CoA carboxylase carboxyl transferase subunit alpha|nr:acetyl-CoA carboxylase carboxyltransferase subunit alpha [Eubacteriaceae bacterium]